MLRVISWKILSKIVETKRSRLIGNNFRYYISNDGRCMSTTDKGKTPDFSKSLDQEKPKVTEPTTKPGSETNEDEKLVTKFSDPTVDEDRGLPPWLIKASKCKKTPPKCVKADKHVEWGKCIHYCLII